jgi:hypothetical protein
VLILVQTTHLMNREDLTERELELKITQIKLLFENGHVKKMRDLEKLSPTMIAKYAGINHGRYSSKLIEPGKFTASEIVRIAYILNIEASVIMGIISNQIIEEEGKAVEKVIKKG